MARGRMADVALPGQIRVVDDVPRAFARLVSELTPRSIALSGGELAQRCYTALRREALEWSVVDVTVAGDEKREPIRRIRAGEDLPGERIRARQVLWLGDRAALEAD